MAAITIPYQPQLRREARVEWAFRGLTVASAALVLLLLAFLFHSQALPEMVWPGSALCVALAGLTIYLLHREVNPR